MSDMKKLLVIFNDGAVAAMLRRNVLQNDDNSTSGEIIGTKDGSIEVSMCSEEFWMKNKKSSADADKILFLGTSKDINATLPKMNIRFSQYGISYGWNGNVALLTVKYPLLKETKDYNEFCVAFEKDFANPNANKVLKSINADFGDECEYLYPELMKKKRLNQVGIVSLAVLTGGLSLAAMPISSNIKEKQQIIQQMYFYGVLHFYLNHLEEYMNS